MPVTVDRKFVVSGKDGGPTLVLSTEEMQAVKTETDITISCHSKKCAARRGATEPLTIRWQEESIAGDATKLPDEFFSLLKVSQNTNPPTEVVFCSPGCLRDWLTYDFVPVAPPRVEIEKAKREQAKTLTKLNPHLVQKTDCPSPVNDATGFVDHEADVHAE